MHKLFQHSFNKKTLLCVLLVQLWAVFLHGCAATLPKNRTPSIKQKNSLANTSKSFLYGDDPHSVKNPKDSSSIKNKKDSSSINENKDSIEENKTYPDVPDVFFLPDPPPTYYKL